MPPPGNPGTKHGVPHTGSFRSSVLERIGCRDAVPDGLCSGISLRQVLKKVLHMTAHLVPGNMEFDGTNVDSEATRCKNPVQYPPNIPENRTVLARGEVSAWLSERRLIAVKIAGCQRCQHNRRGFHAQNARAE